MTKFNVNQTKQKYFFNVDEGISKEDGLAIAATLIGYDENG